MPIKSGVSRTWNISPSSDGKKYSAYPQGDNPGAGSLEPGHLYLQSLTSLWTEYQTFRGSFFAPSRTKQDAQALVNSIPTSGGTTLTTSATASDINTALGSNSVVFLPAGTYAMDRMIDIPAGKWLVGVAGGQITLDFSTNIGTFGAAYGVRLRAGSNLVNVSIVKPAVLGIWFDGNTSFCYKVSVQQCGYPISGFAGDRNGIAFAGGGSGNCFDVCLVSCEALYSQGSTGSPTPGSDADGFNCGTNGGGNWQMVDCHAYGNCDDGFDSWNATDSNGFFRCSSSINGKNPEAGSQGDGNGWKLGLGSVSHYLWKPSTNDNADWAFNWNGNTGPHYIYQPNCVGDDSGVYAFGAGDASKWVVT